MKKIILSLTLITAFMSCEQEKSAPAEEKTVQLANVNSSLLNKNNIKVSEADFELVYDQTGKKLEKINQKLQLFSQTGQPQAAQQASFVIEYNTNNTIKSIQVTPDNSGNAFITAAKYTFTYNGNVLDAYQKEGSMPVTLKYDQKGNIVRRISGTSEETFTYSNNQLVSGGLSFEFSDYKNPLSTLEKGLVMILGNALYAGNIEPVSVDSRFLMKVKDQGLVPNSPPSPSSQSFAVSDAKMNYPLKAEITKSFELSPGSTLTTVIAYKYKNL